MPGAFPLLLSLLVACPVDSEKGGAIEEPPAGDSGVVADDSGGSDSGGEDSGTTVAVAPAAVTILSPADGALLLSTEAAEVRAHFEGSPGEGTWTLLLDGEHAGMGAVELDEAGEADALVATLAPGAGAHTLVLTWEDARGEAGATATFRVNSPPRLVSWIPSGAPGPWWEGDTIDWSVEVADADLDDEAASESLTVRVSDSAGGTRSIGVTPASDPIVGSDFVAPAAGVWDLTFTVIDAAGESASVVVPFETVPSNAPLLEITDPADEAKYRWLTAETIVFALEVSDVEGGRVAVHAVCPTTGIGYDAAITVDHDATTTETITFEFPGPHGVAETGSDGSPYDVTFTATDPEGNSSELVAHIKIVGPEFYDYDEDGYYPGDSDPLLFDCDDADPAIHPGAEEVCDTVDNDCDGWVNEGERDAEDARDTTDALDTDEAAVDLGLITTGRIEDCSSEEYTVHADGDADWFLFETLEGRDQVDFLVAVGSPGAGVEMEVELFVDTAESDSITEWTTAADTPGTVDTWEDAGIVYIHFSGSSARREIYWLLSVTTTTWGEAACEPYDDDPTTNAYSLTIGESE